MLNGEGNEEGKKATIGLNSQKTTLHVQHTIFVYFSDIVLHDYNMKLPSYTFYGGNAVCSLLFFIAAHLVIASFLHFHTAAIKFFKCFFQEIHLLP